MTMSEFLLFSPNIETLNSQMNECNTDPIIMPELPCCLADVYVEVLHKLWKSDIILVLS